MHFSNQKGAIGYLAVVLLLVVSAVYVLFTFVFGSIVPPNYIGIRQNYYGLGFMPKGYQQKGLEPGLQWKIPFLSTIHLIPRDFQFVTFNEDKDLVNADSKLTALDIPTSNGSKVRTDLTVVFRYFDRPDSNPQEKEILEAAKSAQEAKQQETASRHIPAVSFKIDSHGGPSELVNSFTLNRDLQLSRIAQRAENEIKKSLSQLSTTSFYDPVARETKILESHENLKLALSQAGVNVWGTLIRRYLYEDQNIDNQIFEKNLQEQNERLNSGLSQLAKERAETERLVANWDAKISVLKVEGQTGADVIRSQGDLTEAQKRAEGDLLVAEAKARVDSERARVLSDVSGSEVYIAREMVPILETLTGGVITGIDPFSISSWVDRLTGTNAK